jgi:hypothetical protein
MPEPLLPLPLVMPPELVVQQHLPATAATTGAAAETSGTSDAAATAAAAGATSAGTLHSPHTVSSRRAGTAPPVLAVGKQQRYLSNLRLNLTFLWVYSYTVASELHTWKLQ